MNAVILMAEIWFNFTSFVDSHSELKSTIFYMLKRALKDSSNSLKLVAAGQLFSLLELFSLTKN